MSVHRSDQYKKSECVACAPQSVSPCQCRSFVSLIEVFGANLPRVDSVPTQHGSMEEADSSYEHKFLSRLDAMVFRVMNMTPKVGEHDRPTEGRSLIQVAAAPPSLRQMAIVCLTHEASEAARHAQVATADPDAARGTRVSIFGRSPAGGNRYPLSLAIADASGADRADDRGNIKEACAEMKWLSDTKNPSIRTAAPRAESAVS